MLLTSAGSVNIEGNNVNNKNVGVRPASSYRPKHIAGAVRLCIRQRNPVPFRTERSQQCCAEKHIPQESIDADGALPDRRLLSSLKRTPIMVFENPFPAVT